MHEVGRILARLRYTRRAKAGAGRGRQPLVRGLTSVDTTEARGEFTVGDAVGLEFANLL